MASFMRAACGGMVAPLYERGISEEELRNLVGDRAYCMRCHERGWPLDAEYAEEDDDGGSTH